MLLGYNTNGFASHALDDALRVIAEIGYRSVGLTLDHHALNPLAEGANREAKRIARLLAELRLTVVVETGARFLLDPRRKHRPTLLEDEPEARRVRLDFLLRAVDVATELGAGVVSLWSGARPESSGATPSELDDRLVEGLRAVCERAAASGVTIGFEPEPGMHVETMAHFERVRDRVGHDALALTLDVGHAHLTEPSGAAETVRRYAGSIVNVHLEGMNRDAHEHLPPWEGDLDVREVVSVLRAVRYEGPATLELSRHSHDAVRIARRAFEFLQASS